MVFKSHQKIHFTDIENHCAVPFPDDLCAIWEWFK